ncbi:hypothetical protein CIP107518_01796 [Corynebacterium diphtheriae]|nr:hypothetical protein CIP107518_01796 [Corynebacterium diphtheriae]
MDVRVGVVRVGSGWQAIVLIYVSSTSHVMKNLGDVGKIF